MVVHDLAGDPRFEPSQEEALGRGYVSAAQPHLRSSSWSRNEFLFPIQRPARLIFGHARFEEILFFFQVQHL